MARVATTNGAVHRYVSLNRRVPRCEQPRRNGFQRGLLVPDTQLPNCSKDCVASTEMANRNRTVTQRIQQGRRCPGRHVPLSVGLKPLCCCLLASSTDRTPAPAPRHRSLSGVAVLLLVRRPTLNRGVKQPRAVGQKKSTMMMIEWPKECSRALWLLSSCALPESCDRPVVPPLRAQRPNGCGCQSKSNKCAASRQSKHGSCCWGCCRDKWRNGR